MATAGRAEAMQAGIPTPVVRRAADREPGTPRHVAPGSGRPGRGGRRRTAAARRPTAARGCRPVRAEQADRVGEVGERRARPARRRVPGASCSSRCRPTEHAAPAAPRPPPASRTQSHLAKENVEALIARPSTGGTRKPDPRRRGKSRGGKASVTIAIEAYSIRASSSGRARRDVAEQPGGRRRAGVASTTASACTTSGVAGRADDEVPAAVGPAARSRTVAPVRTVAPPAAASAAGSRPTPPRSPAKTGRGRRPGRQCAAAARVRERSRSSSATSCGTAARAEISRAWPAYTPPSSGSTSRSTTSLPRRSSTRSPTLTSVAAELGRRQDGVQARPGQPLAESTPSRRAARGRPAHPSRARHRHAGARGSRGAAAVVAGWTSRRGPTSRARSTASGRRLSIASAPTSTHDPADLGGAQVAADARRALEHDDLDVRPLGRGPVRRGQARRCRHRPRRRRAGVRRGSGTRSACRTSVAAQGTRTAGHGARHSHMKHAPRRGSRRLGVALLLVLTACSAASSRRAPTPAAATAADAGGRVRPATWPTAAEAPADDRRPRPARPGAARDAVGRHRPAGA